MIFETSSLKIQHRIFLPDQYLNFSNFHLPSRSHFLNSRRSRKVSITAYRIATGIMTRSNAKKSFIIHPPLPKKENGAHRLWRTPFSNWFDTTTRNYLRLVFSFQHDRYARLHFIARPALRPHADRFCHRVSRHHKKRGKMDLIAFRGFCGHSENHEKIPRSSLKILPRAARFVQNTEDSLRDRYRKFDAGLFCQLRNIHKHAVLKSLLSGVFENNIRFPENIIHDLTLLFYETRKAGSQNPAFLPRRFLNSRELEKFRGFLVRLSAAPAAPERIQTIEAARLAHEPAAHLVIVKLPRLEFAAACRANDLRMFADPRTFEEAEALEVREREEIRLTSRPEIVLRPTRRSRPFAGFHRAYRFPEMASPVEIPDVGGIEMILFDLPNGTFQAVTGKRILEMFRVAGPEKRPEGRNIRDMEGPIFVPDQKEPVRIVFQRETQSKIPFHLA